MVEAYLEDRGDEKEGTQGRVKIKCLVFFQLDKIEESSESFLGCGTLMVRIRWLVLKNSFRICPRINDLALTLTWTSLRDWGLADIWFFRPVGFSFLSCLSFEIVELLQ